jgi:hypothetical protein
MNSFGKRQVKILVYRDNTEGVWYGSALEFNLTVDGDDKNTVLLELDRALIEYIKSAQEIGSTDPLNQEPDPELLNLWMAHNENRHSELSSPYTPYVTATESLAHV